MHPYRKLSVWKKAHHLTLRVYASVSSFTPAHAALGHQLRRAAHSIPANIVEGSGRASNRAFAYHLQVAIASARELDYLLQLALDLRQIAPKEHATLEARADEVTRMMVALRRTVVVRADKT